jgi:alpha-tubulin suppressor-like RCC1 family protein
MKKFLILPLLFSLATSGILAQNLVLTGGNNFSATLCSNALVYTMGANNVNQLGQGSTTLGFSSTPLSVPGLPNNLKQITAGSGAHATALACDGSVWTWGLNNCGQLGQGGAVSSCGYPICATDGIARQNGLNNGSSQSCSYCNSWGNVGMVSGLPAISYVAGGNLATYAVASIGGSVWAWGVNEAGQLGD